MIGYGLRLTDRGEVAGTFHGEISEVTTMSDEAQIQTRTPDNTERAEIARIRAEFPVIQRYRYFNAGTNGPLPQCRVVGRSTFLATHARFMRQSLPRRRGGSIGCDGGSPRRSCELALDRLSALLEVRPAFVMDRDRVPIGGPRCRKRYLTEQSGHYLVPQSRRFGAPLSG